jgi:SOS-response transcriptional repressor LexA
MFVAATVSPKDHCLAALQRAKAMTNTDLHDDVQARHVRWLKFVERATGKTLTELSLEAGMSHTTLRRVLRDEHVGHLSAASIAKVKKLTRLPGPDEFEQPEAQRQIQAAGLREEVVPFDFKSEGYGASAVKAIVGGRNNVHAWTMKNAALEGAGIQPGDTLIIDHMKRPNAGEVVCAQVYDQPGGLKAETVMRIYKPGWLVAASRDPLGFDPVQIVDSKVAIMGTMVALLRECA